MKKIIFLLFISMSFSQSLTAQNLEGNHQIYAWIDDNAQQDSTGTAVLDFRTYPPTATKLKIKRKNLSATMSDENGNLLFYTDMCGIYNKNHEMMPNGEFIADSNLWQPNCDLPDFHQTTVFREMPLVILPNPNKKNVYTIFFMKFYKYQFVQMKPVYFTVDMSKNNGLGEVVEYNVPFAPVQNYNIMINAIRHSNGNDWILFLRGDSDNMFLYIFNSSGIHFLKTCKMSAEKSYFSFAYEVKLNQQGTKLCENIGNTLILYDFNRCNLTFSNPVKIEVKASEDSTIFLEGYYSFAFSPNSKYLYACMFDSIVQYDISSNLQPFPKKTIAYSERPPSHPGGSVKRTFDDTLLGEDNRLYIIGGGYPFIHVIHHPDEAGAACNFERDAINLPVFPSGFQNYPNFGLGAVDPPCKDEKDGCMPNDTTAHSKWVVYPNPTARLLKINANEAFKKGQTFTFYLFDALGRLMLSEFLECIPHQIDLGDLPDAGYFYKINDASGKQLTEGRIIKIDEY